MTRQQQQTINNINAKDEAQRFEASQASREVAKLIEEAVIIACEVKIKEGRMDEARAIWRAYREGK